MYDCPRRNVLCRFSCVVSRTLWFLRSFLPRRKVISRFACVVSWFPSACALLLPRRNVLCRFSCVVSRNLWFLRSFLPRRNVFRCFACVVGEAGVRTGSIHISRVESVSEAHDAHFWCYSEWCGTDEEQPLCRVVWNHDEEPAVSYGLHELVPCQDKV